MQISLVSSADEVSDARLHRLCNALINDGKSVEVIALGRESDAPTGVTFKKAIGGKSFTWRIIRDLTIPFQTKGEVVIVVAPDLLATTWLTAKLRRQKLVADVHEDYLQLLKDRSWAKGVIGFLAGLIARAASQIAKSAALTTVADEHVPPHKAKNRLVVRNLPDASLITSSGELSSTPTAIYIGDIRSSRGLKKILESAEIATNWKFELIGSVAAADKDYLENWQRTSAAANRVSFHGKLAPKQSWQYAKGAWVGLSLLDATPAFIDAVPSKLYEYLTCGLAVVTTDLPRSAKVISESNSGVIANTPSEIANALNKFEENKDLIIQLRSNGANWAKNNLDSPAEYHRFTAAISNLLK
jgi:glycosyltransferase involved in cell wall biosynthesis